jgi:putative ubiquitin-RnfH superfamily antitoxin RatB of RatAB toxin-antitoxin module
MRVQVAYAATGLEALVDVQVGPGAVIADAVAVSGLVQRLGLDASRLAYAIHGQRAAPDTPLAEGDRVELLEPLQADPKAVRRRRALEKPLANVPRQTRRRRRDGEASG